MVNKVTDLVYKSLTTNIAPMVYIMMFVNILIGLFFATGWFMAGNESILYNTGVLVDRQIWGAALLTTATIAEVGFIKKNPKMIEVGGIAGFALWAFASISLLIASHWYLLFTISLFHLLFHGYVVLASSTNVIQR